MIEYRYPSRSDVWEPHDMFISLQTEKYYEFVQRMPMAIGAYIQVEGVFLDHVMHEYLFDIAPNKKNRPQILTGRLGGCDINTLRFTYIAGDEIQYRIWCVPHDDRDRTNAHVFYETKHGQRMLGKILANLQR